MIEPLAEHVALSIFMPDQQFQWNAPAKVNLTLKVLGKRDDGFHALESLMVPLDLADTLTFEKAAEYCLLCDAPGVPVDESNLVTMAVRLFQQYTEKSCAWKVTLEKKVPHGAGLGGGSSDAATAMLALNQLENAGLSVAKMAGMLATIGSDIPFFVYQQACMIRGRGEVVEPVDGAKLKGIPILLLKPQFGVDTPDAYQRWSGAQEIPGVNYQAQMLPWGEIVNDLEKPVFQKHRFLAEMKEWLLDQPEVAAAMMSGSGSTMMAFLKEDGGGCGGDALLDRARSNLDPTLWGCKVEVQ
jgi:4-diphosphocytidyl-2-C-methyl-D-erythritol kinase